MLEGKIWENKASSNMTVYVDPFVSVFGFGIEPISGNMSESEVQVRMLDSCGSMAKFWVVSLHKAKTNGRDIGKVLEALGEDARKSLIL